MTTAWTRERPTKPGWYWCRPRYAPLYVAKVVMGADGNPAVEGDDGYEWPLGDDCEWAPAEPPP